MPQGFSSMRPPMQNKQMPMPRQMPQRPPVEKLGAAVMAEAPQEMKDAGRFGDSELAHVTEGEIVIPLDVQTPELISFLKQSFQQAGVPFERYVVSDDESGDMGNPETGQSEFFLGKVGKILGKAAPIIGAATGFPMAGQIAGAVLGGMGGEEGASGASGGVSGMSPSRTLLPAPVEAATRQPSSMNVGSVNYSSIEEPTYIKGNDSSSFASDTGLSGMTPFNPSTGRREYYGCNSKNPMTGKKEYYGNSINPKTNMREFAGELYYGAPRNQREAELRTLMPGVGFGGGNADAMVLAKYGATTLNSVSAPDSPWKGGVPGQPAATPAASSPAPSAPVSTPAKQPTIMSYTPAAQKGGGAGFYLLSDGTKVSDNDMLNYQSKNLPGWRGDVDQQRIVGTSYGTAVTASQPATTPSAQPVVTPVTASQPPVTSDTPQKSYTDAPVLSSTQEPTATSSSSTSSTPGVGSFSTLSPRRTMRFRGGRSEGGGRSGAYARNF